MLTVALQDRIWGLTKVMKKQLTPYKIGHAINERNIQMTRTFIEIPLFTRRWKEIGLGDKELQALQIML